MVEIHNGPVDWTYRELGLVQARVTSATIFSRTRTTEEVDSKLREEAMKRGADAVIYVHYERGMSNTSYKALTAKGMAVVHSDSPVTGTVWQLPSEKKQAKKAKKEKKAVPAWPS